MEKYCIRLPIKFDFHYHKNFNKEIEALWSDSNVGEVELDFSAVQYLDSAALGMLVLLFKKNEQNKQVKLVITGAHGVALNILEMANMSKLYQIN